MLLSRFNRYFGTTTLQYISDIHLERLSSFPRIDQKSKNIALIGDIGDPFKNNYSDFLKFNSDHFERVFLVAGNHEYWRGSYNKVNDQIQNVTQKLPNVEFLNNSCTTLNEFTILGGVLWTPFVTSSSTLHNNNSPSVLHNKTVKFIVNSINDYQKLNNLHDYHQNNVIVLTHYLPSYKLITPNFCTNAWDHLHNKYASHLDHLIVSPVRAWLCGHSHCTLETTINGVFCAINSLGYNQYTQKNIRVLNCNGSSAKKIKIT